MCYCFSDAISRGCSVSNWQLLPQRGFLRLLQVHRGAGLQVCTLQKVKTHLMIQQTTPNRAICGVCAGSSPLPAQTNFMASYIHLDAHCPASLDELEARDIDTHRLWQARAKKPDPIAQWSVKLQALLIWIFHNLFSIFPALLNWHEDWCAGAPRDSLASVANIKRRSSSSITTPSTEQVSQI